MIRVYGDINSGNCCKVKLLMSLPDIEHQWSHVDVLGQETRSPSFLAMNPNGKMPVMEIAPGTHPARICGSPMPFLTAAARRVH